MTIEDISLYKELSNEDCLDAIIAGINLIVHMDTKHGGTLTLAPAMKFFQLSMTKLRDTDWKKTLFAERNRYAAELYELMAWILFDAGYHRQSWVYNVQGLLYSIRAGDSGIRNFILSNMNLHTLVSNKFTTTHYLSEFAVKNLSLPQSACALFHSRDAIAHAHIGNHDTAKKLITAAENIFSYRNGKKEQYWSSWINETIILWHKALTYNACKDYDHALEILENASKKLNNPHTRVSKIIDHTTQNIHNRKPVYENIWKQ